MWSMISSPGDRKIDSAAAFASFLEDEVITYLGDLSNSGGRKGIGTVQVQSKQQHCFRGNYSSPLKIDRLPAVIA